MPNKVRQKLKSHNLTELDTDQLRALFLLRKLARSWPKSLGLVFHADGGGLLRVVDIRGADNKATFDIDPARYPSIESVQLPVTGCV